MIDKHSILFSKQMKKHFNAEIKAIRKTKIKKNKNIFPQENIKNAYKILKQSFNIGNFNTNYKPHIIHVVGSNGKGSTCFYLEQELLKNNKSVGLFSSPHLLEITERFRIRNKDLSYTNLHRSYNFLEKILSEAIFKQLSFFDLCFLMAMENFFKAKVDYIILEAGLGGRLDSTRQAKGEMILLTSISKEHTALLGKKKKAIALEKLMIIHSKQKCNFFYHPEKIQDLERIKNIIAKQEKKYFSNTSCYFLLEKDRYTNTSSSSLNNSLPSIKNNYILAKVVSDFLISKISFKENLKLSSTILYKNNKTCKPINNCRYLHIINPKKYLEDIPRHLLKGRNELYIFKNTKLAFDGAHNPAAIGNLLNDLIKYFKKKSIKLKYKIKIHIICALQKDKNKAAIRKLFKDTQKKLNSKIILTFDLDTIKENNTKKNYHIENSFNKWNSSSLEEIPYKLYRTNKDRENLFIVCGSFSIYSDFLKLRDSLSNNLNENYKKAVLWESNNKIFKSDIEF